MIVVAERDLGPCLPVFIPCRIEDGCTSMGAYPCPRCCCRSQGCTERALSSGHCADHEGYYKQREEDNAERRLGEELKSLRRIVIELAALLIAPCERALSVLDQAEEIRDEERASRGGEASHSELGTLSLHLPTDWRGETLTEYNKVGTYRGKPQYDFIPVQVGDDAAGLRSRIARSLDAVTELFDPPADGPEMFRQVRMASDPAAAAFLQMVKSAAIYTEAIDE